MADLQKTREKNGAGQQFAGNIRVTRLKRADDFVCITNGAERFYGGNQDWFPRFTQEYGGCGPTAAANITAYLAGSDPRLGGLYGYDKNTVTRADFEKHMEEIYKYVPPTNIPVLEELSDELKKPIGMPSIGTFIEVFILGTERYAKSRGVRLMAKKETTNGSSFQEALALVREGLEKDRPVALLNNLNDQPMPVTNINNHATHEEKLGDHWVAVTGMEENTETGEVTLSVSTWGYIGKISFNKVWDRGFSIFPSAVMYFDLKQGTGCFSWLFR